MQRKRKDGIKSRKQGKKYTRERMTKTKKQFTRNEGNKERQNIIIMRITNNS